MITQVSSSADQCKDESLEVPASVSRAESSEGGYGPEVDDAPPDDAHHLVKLSYHDSGIDIRDPLLNVTPANAKKVSFYVCRKKTINPVNRT